MAYSVKLYFDAAEVNITSLIITSSFKKEESLYKSLKPNTNTCSFSVIPDVVLYNYLLTWNGDIGCTITENNNPYFKGYVSPTFQNNIKAGRGLEQFTLQIEDVGIKALQRVCKQSFIYVGYKICDCTTPTASVVHKILALAEITEYNLSTINVVLPFYNYNFDEKKTYWDMLTDLLYEACYTFYFDESGVFQIHKWDVASLVSIDVWGSTTILKKNLQVKKSREEYSKVVINWSSIELKEDAIIYEDTSGGDNTNRCNITVNPGDEYPTDSVTKNVFTEYKSSEYEIISAITASLSVTQAGLTLSKTLTNYGNKATFGYANNTGVDKYITKLQIIGDAYVEKSKNTTIKDIQDIAGRDDKELEVEAKYIYSEAYILSFINGLKNHYKYSDIQYTITTSEDVPIGTIVQIDEDVYTGSQTYVKIINKTSTILNDFTYVAEGVGAYTSEAIDSELSVIKAGQQTVLLSDVASTPVYKIKSTSQAVLVKPLSEYIPDACVFSSVVYQGMAAASPLLGIYKFYLNDVHVATSSTAISSYSWTGFDTSTPGQITLPSTGLTILDHIPSSEYLLTMRVDLYDEEDTYILDQINVVFVLDWTMFEDDVIDSIRTYSPTYLGRFNASHPASYAKNDSWLVYDTDDTPIQRGIYYYDGLTETRIAGTEADLSYMISSALPDILWASKNGYGIVDNYGAITYIQNFVSSIAFIETLSSVDLTIYGSISVDNEFVYKGVFKKDRFYQQKFY
jgi:hypothetical protein